MARREKRTVEIPALGHTFEAHSEAIRAIAPKAPWAAGNFDLLSAINQGDVTLCRIMCRCCLSTIAVEVVL
jgi:hypothetical protein